MFNQSIWPQILSHAARQPDAKAVICGDQSATYLQLVIEVEKRIEQLPATLIEAAQQAHALGNKELQPRLGLYLSQDIELVYWILAAIAVGANLTIFDESWPERQVENLCKQLNLRCLISTNLALSTCDVLHPKAQKVSGEKGDRTVEISGAHKDMLAPDRKASMFLFTGLTSASSGPAKAYQRTELSWLKTFGFDQELFDFKPGNVIAAPGPLGHSLFLYASMRALYAGATVWLTPHFAPKDALRRMGEVGVSHLFAVPTYLQSLLEPLKRQAAQRIDSLEWIISAGAKLAEPLKQDAKNLGADKQIAEIFGTSEHSTIAMAHSGADWPQDSVGKPPQDVSITIVDEDGQALPRGEVGEIFVHSPALFSGYAGDNAPIPRAHIQYGLSVGDMGWLDEADYLYVTGRRDRMILSAGHTLHPEPIEQALEQYPDIERAVIVGLDDEKRGARLCAFVSMTPELGKKSAEPAKSTLIRHLCTTLPAHAVPRRFFHVQRWPLTRSGKIDVHALLRLHALSPFEALH